MIFAAAAVAAASVAAPGSAQVTGDRALGQYLSSECVTCHQLTGKQQPGIPAIDGKPAASLVEQLNAYRTKQRPNEVMQNIAARLSSDDIAALAVYFSSLKPRN